MKSFFGFSIFALAFATPTFSRPSGECTPIFEDKVFNCPEAGDHLSFDQVSVNPSSPRRGDTLSIVVSGTVHQPVLRGANVQCDIYIRDTLLISRTIDVCDGLEGRGKQCPVQAKSVNIETTFPIPDFIPPATYDIRCLGKNADGSRLGQIRILADIQYFTGSIY